MYHFLDLKFVLAPPPFRELSRAVLHFVGPREAWLGSRAVRPLSKALRELTGASAPLGLFGARPGNAGSGTPPALWPPPVRDPGPSEAKSQRTQIVSRT